MKTRLAVLLLLGSVLAACQAQGPAVNRADFRYQWLSYLQGDDMRGTCRADGPDRLRLIYNADFNKEIRTYDLFIANGGTGVLDTRRWVSAGNLVSLQGGNLSSLLEGQKGQVSLSANQVVELTSLVAQSGFPGPVPVGTNLRSDAYFWVGLACVDGVFGIQVWQGDALRNVRFAGLLESWDPIGAPLPAAKTGSLPPLASVIASNRRNRDASLLYYEAVVRQAAIQAHWRS